MKSYQFKGVLTQNGWIKNAVVMVDENGAITSISSEENHNAELVNGFALPGFQNTHSHAFQYAMAGLAELHEGSGVPDDFWSWRSTMYNLALTLSPQHLEDIAAMLYVEMLRNGYTSVAEFHYLHHDTHGNPYTNLAEHGERLVAAAKKVGIRITLVPIFYQKGGFGLPPENKQKRFISSSLEAYYKLYESSKTATTYYKNASIGLGVHSLRAVSKEVIVALCRDFRDNQPFHIHVSEQLKEIEDCQNFYGKRPVEWLLDNCKVTPNFHLVHATHLNDNELKGIAKAGANVVLCPSTEGNLGDGLFRLRDFKALQGQWSIGTDSHVGLNPFEELRLLDYGQRIATNKRDTFYVSGKGDSGFNAIKMIWQTGKKAMGDSLNTFFEVGKPFDAVVMHGNIPLISNTSEKNWCNTFVYSCDASHILGTIVDGHWVVKQGVHDNCNEVSSNFINTMKDLEARM